jgi:two-component sensor histidine kinase
LIDDVLDLTKIEGDRLTLKLQSQAVLPLIQEAVAALQASVQAKDLKLQVEVAPLVETVTLTLDAQRFQQVMSNLLSNAVKHSPQQGVVRVIVGMDGASVRITVRDQGPGVPPEFRDRLFSKFAQADGSDGRVHGGAGLGLYISHLLVDRMGGRIEIDAQEGEGASFSLLFPLTSRGERRPVALLIDADVSSPDVLQELLGDRVQIVHSAVLPAAAEMAKAQLVLANPQGQGDADLFVATLRRKLGAKPIMLWGDCMDEEYAGRVGLPWLAGRREDRDALRAWARVSLAQQ